MKSFLFVISALAIFAGTQADFDPFLWCAEQPPSRNFIQFKANPDNLTEYFQCERTRTGFVPHKLACHKCFVFSDDLSTCVKVASGDCEPTEAPITEVITYDSKWCYVKGNGPAGLYLQLFRQGSVRYKYVWDIGGGAEVEMSCPPGTFFDFIQCRCIWCDGLGPCAIASNRVFTLDFDHTEYQNGIYFDFAYSLRFSTGPSGIAAKFDGDSTSIEVPFFQNNEFSQFTFVVSFLRDSGDYGAEPILYNGATPSTFYEPPSIYVNIANERKVVAGIITNKGSYQVTSRVVLPDGVWASLILRYNGVKLELWVNGVYDSADAYGVTLRIKDDLKIGQGFDADGVYYFFKGLIDDLSWYRTAIQVPIGPDDLPPN